MLFIYGGGWYGRVYECEGEYIATQFLHLYFVPLLPVESMWVVGAEEQKTGWKTKKVLRGMKISLHPVSILTAYLRTWGTLGSVYTFMSGKCFWGSVLLGLCFLSLLWANASPMQQARQRFFAAVTGIRCDPNLLPREVASELLARLMGEWRTRYGEVSLEDSLALQEPRGVLLAHAMHRLMYRVHRSEQARAMAEALFQKHHVQDEPKQMRGGRKQEQGLRMRMSASPPESEQAPRGGQAFSVLEGSLRGFSEVGAEGAVVLAWYRPEQWNRLREVSSDVQDLPSSYSAWLLEASQVVEQRAGNVLTVDVDVEELVRSANLPAGQVDREMRARFVHQKTRGSSRLGSS